MLRNTKRILFQTQIDLTLIIMAAKLDVKLLPLAYNCRNDDSPFSVPEESRLNSVDDIRVIHYPLSEQVERRILRADFAAYEAFVPAPDLNRANAGLRDQLRTPVWH